METLQNVFYGLLTIAIVIAGWWIFIKGILAIFGN